MKIKTSELTGAALDWAIAVAEHDELAARTIQFPDYAPFYPKVSPSTNWAQGGPIIERESITTMRLNDLYFPNGNEAGDYWESYFSATSQQTKQYGPTPLVAAMRCHVANKLGDIVEIPEELLQGAGHANP